MLALCAASASERSVGHAFVVQYCGEFESYAAVMAVIRCPEIVTVSVSVPYRSLDDALYVPSRGPVAVGVGFGVTVGFDVDFVDGAVGRAEADGFADAWPPADGAAAGLDPPADAPGGGITVAASGPETAVAEAAPEAAKDALPNLAPTSRPAPVRVPRTTAVARRKSNPSPRTRMDPCECACAGCGVASKP